jgi:hypothetical protein
MLKSPTINRSVCLFLLANRLLEMFIEMNDHAVVKRRWTDELTRSDSTARNSGLIQGENNIHDVGELRLKQLFEHPGEADGTSVLRLYSHVTPESN